MQKKSLIEKLHDIQENQKNTNHLPKDMIIEAAKESNVSLSKAFGVATFYTMFSTQKRGKHIIRICQNQSCHMANSALVVDELKKTLCIDFGETSEDGLFTLEHSSCLGMCSIAPCMMIDDRPYGNLTPGKVVEIIHSIKVGA